MRTSVECRVSSVESAAARVIFSPRHPSPVTRHVLRRAAFTLIEVMVAMAILTVVIGAIYSTWTGIVKASKVGLDAAAAAQRERMAIRVVEDALAAAQLFVANPKYYSFAAENGSEASLTFTARLGPDFPRSGKFGDFDMRRVQFSIEGGGGYAKQLVLRQSPILMEMDEDEQSHPVVLARDVKKFQAEFWDTVANDWTDAWLLTNQLPKLVRLTLQLNYAGTRGVDTSPVITRVIALPTAGVQPNWQMPNVQGGPAPGGPGNVPPVPIQPRR